MRGHGVTNLILVLIAVLLLANLGVPLMREEAPPPVREKQERIPDELRADLRRIAEDLRVVMRLGPPAARGTETEAPEDALVVRIPGRIADEWGLTAEDVRTLVEGLAQVAKRSRSMRTRANDVSAIATLRNLSSAQAQFQATAKADADGDGTGEFGAFKELSGAEDVRHDARVGRLNPPVLSGAFRNPKDGFVSRSGYYFVVYLPDGAGSGIVADSAGYSAVSADLAETTWCAYAWPVNEKAGTRTFMVNQTGDVIYTESPHYVGTRAPSPGAGFIEGGQYSIHGRTALGKQGQDGNPWRQVN